MSQNIPPRSLPPEDEPDQGIPEARKEQYSLDEMMKALREKEREKEAKGEVVTRSDGTVARKVKRRKRRSEQPEKANPEKEKTRLLVKVIIAAALVLILLLVAFSLLVMQNSKGFREKLEAKASDWTGAEVEFNGYKRFPYSTTMEEASFKWSQDSFVRSLEVQKLRGDVDFRAFLGARPGGLQFGGKVGQMVVGMPSKRGPTTDPLPESDFPFSFDQYFCQTLDVTFGASENFGLKGTSATLRYINNEGFQVTLDQGMLQMAGWKDFPISSGLFRYKNGAIDLKSLALEQPVKDDAPISSSLKVSGEIPLVAGERVRLDLKSGRYSMRGLAGTQLGRFFSGEITESSGELDFRVGEDSFDQIEVRFLASRVKMEGFPFLGNLHELFPDQHLDDLEFNTGVRDSAIKGVLRARPEGIAIEKLEMADKKNIRLKGGIIITKAGAIRGKFDLWINRVFVTTQPKLANNPAFQSEEGTGYVHFQFRLGGTVDEPDDNFRIVSNMEAALPGAGNREPSPVDEDLWKEATSPDLDLTPDILRDQPE